MGGIGRIRTCYFVLAMVVQVQLYNNGVRSLNLYQAIHRFWPSLREADALQYNSTDDLILEHKQTMTNTSGSPRRTLVYGSPICVGQCVILQIYWSNSSTSLLGVKLPDLPTFPRPREVIK